MVRAFPDRLRRTDSRLDSGSMTSASNVSAAEIAIALKAGISARQSFAEPYPYHLVANILPRPVIRALAELPFEAPDLHGVSGKRELHNDSRSYFDKAGMERFPVMRAVA